jgi:hypothetical protein
MHSGFASNARATINHRTGTTIGFAVAKLQSLSAEPTLVTDPSLLPTLERLFHTNRYIRIPSPTPKPRTTAHGGIPPCDGAKNKHRQEYSPTIDLRCGRWHEMWSGDLKLAKRFFESPHDHQIGKSGFVGSATFRYWPYYHSHP